jgi:hypothetical protein
MSTDARLAVAYWHLWTDDGGLSRQTRCLMTTFQKKAIQPQAAPQWIGALEKDHMTVFFTVLPVNWVGDWHENPRPQWIIPLAGRWFVESMDGQRVEMGPGEISFGEDQKTRQHNGKRGHLSGTIGDEPVTLMIVQLDGKSTIASPCRFK